MTGDTPTYTPRDIQTQAIYDKLRLEIKPIVYWKDLLEPTSLASVYNTGIPIGQYLYTSYATEHPDHSTAEKPFPEDLEERLSQQMRFVDMANKVIDGKIVEISKEGLNDILVAAEQGNPDLVDLMLGDKNLKPGDNKVRALKAIARLSKAARLIKERNLVFDGKDIFSDTDTNEMLSSATYLLGQLVYSDTTYMM